MYALHILNKWANANTNIFVDLLRVLFGGFLLFKGVHFVNHSDYLVGILYPVDELLASFYIIHAVVLVHIAGGVLVAVGLLTRLAIILQLPILFGAVLINFFGEFNVSNLIIALITFVLGLFFLVFGSGKHSVDYEVKLNA